MIGVGIIEAFGESIDEDAGIGGLDINLRVRAVIVRDGEEDIPRHLVRIVPLPESATRSVGVFAIIIQQMIPNHRVHLDLAQEAAAGFDDAEQEEGGRGGDGGVDAVLDGGEDGDEDAGQENDDFERRDAPELIDRVGRGDEIEDGVDDDGRQGGARDVKKHGGEGVDGQEHDEGGDDAGEGGADAGLGFDGGAGEGAGGGIGAQERPQQVRHADGDHLLRGVDGVVVDAAKRLGDGDVLDQQDNHRRGQFAGEGGDDVLVDRRHRRILKPCGVLISHTADPGPKAKKKRRKSRKAGKTRKKENRKKRRKKNAHVPRGTVPRILNSRCFLPRWCRLTSQLIMVYNRITKAVRKVAIKKNSLLRFGIFRAPYVQA